MHVAVPRRVPVGGGGMLGMGPTLRSARKGASCCWGYRLSVSFSSRCIVHSSKGHQKKTATSIPTSQEKQGRFYHGTRAKNTSSNTSCSILVLSSARGDERNMCVCVCVCARVCVCVCSE